MQFEALPSPFALTIAANSLAVRESLVEIGCFAMRRGFGTGFSADLQIILAEVLNNIVEHAYGDNGGEVVVTLTPQARGFAVQIVDWGRPMPCGTLPSGHLPLLQPVDLYDQPEGGFGWALIRSLARDLTYRRDPGCNLLTFVVPLMSD